MVLLGRYCPGHYETTDTLPHLTRRHASVSVSLGPTLDYYSQNATP